MQYNISSALSDVICQRTGYLNSLPQFRILWFHKHRIYNVHLYIFILIIQNTMG